MTLGQNSLPLQSEKETNFEPDSSCEDLCGLLRHSFDDSDDDSAKLAQTQMIGPKRNPRHYFSLVTFHVGNQLFRVPRERFEYQSQVFSDMFHIKTPNGEGETDDNPIRLEQIDEDAFDDLLQLLYPEHPNGPRLLRISSVPLCDRWLKVLDLAHMWQFKAIKDFCISKLEEFAFDEIRKTIIAHKYEITRWYMKAYIALAKRQQPLTVEESQHFTKEFIVKLAQVRELDAPRKQCQWDHSEDTELKNDVKRIFGFNKPLRGILKNHMSF